MRGSKKKLDPLVEGYLEYATHVGRKTPRTVSDMRCTLRRVGESMARLCPEKTLCKITLNDFLRWLEELREDHCASSCLAKFVSHVRGFLEYAWRSGRTDRNVLDGFRLQDARPKSPPRALSMDETKRLVEACQKRTADERRDRAIVLVLYGCGVRTAELCSLKVQDVDRERGELMVLKGKGDRQRVVPIPEGVLTELCAYLLDRGQTRGPLFRTAGRGSALSAHDVSQVVKARATAAGIAWKVTPKTLRHTYATHLMDRGVDVAIIASLMGHKSPTETGVYLHVVENRPREAVEKLGGDGGGRS
jgi:site-specific recombinase XerD